MTAYLVFNELSITTGAANPSTGKEYLDGLAEILLDSRISGKKVFVTPSLFTQLQICKGYSIGLWLKQFSPEDNDKRLRIKMLVDRCVRYDECIPTGDLESKDVEYTFVSEIAQGLSTAVLVDGLALSVLSAPQWDSAKLRISKSWIEAGDVETRNLDVLHACRAIHLDQHSEWLRQIKTPLPINGQQLCSQMEFLFPRLDFCDSVKDQVKNLGGDGRNFRAVMRGFWDLQKYCESWSGGGFDIHALSNASGESEPTLVRYSNERTFRCPDGEFRLFDWHLKRGDIRIYFFDFPNEMRLLVGYAGGHLRTMLNP